MADKSVKEMGKAELATELLELRKEQFNLRMQNSTGQMTNSSRFKVIRREIARIKTQMNDINRAEA
ncbi:MAG TPA: 50S ribosomal protein L29 [Gammaproteobacteria bacterium]|jgi:large subunit ribosomal protein L29|nr:50S ribosomal protein L29 [Gammaproteobacteria bacterium]MDE0972154.1 50S ribosomal protein L29 [Arenicellales bacterium]HIF79362.1 50S ribosomal protein L29 [Gammaproteobacteria bacterium]HIM05981.1 50S ribosomal protein L29 [Gammaproteobacteria bacterium]|tara:strand:+ start:375 stop:572 length:198 start_codon:yes stop_codon:yes gene_type:complete